ncbi:MAG: hypothetical protein IH591_08795 [Bacteroidales bacterium]|nr:hypothetical protein [Bacteroidales bacterium]
MKNGILFTFSIMMLYVASCNGQQSANVSASQDNDRVEVIYFHNTSRCVTCVTVENVARNYILEQYAAQAASGKISFSSYNIEQADGKAVAERVGVNSQSLMVVKGNQKINLINDGFMYAVNKPEKFQEIIKSKVDPLLK